MNRTMEGCLLVNRGVASRAELEALGVSKQTVDRAIAAGDLVRTGRGALVDAHLWHSAESWQKHELRARSAMRVLHGEPLALSHHSALSVMSLPVYSVDSRVHLARTDTRPGRSGNRWTRHAGIPAKWISEVEGMQVVHAGMASLQVADAFGVEAGLVSADAAITAGTTTAHLTEALTDGRFGRGVSSARTVATMADGRMESPGESRARWVIRMCGFAAPEPQVTIRSKTRFVARVDFLFRQERIVVEFDGMLKYQSPEDLRAEKRREDGLRALGYEVVRLTWRDLDRPVRVRALLLAAFERSARLRAS